MTKQAISQIAPIHHVPMPTDSIALAKEKLVELQSEHGEVSASAQTWFVSSGHRYVAFLIDSLNGTSSDFLKEKIIRVLGELRAAEAVQPIQTLLNSGHYAWPGAYALGQIGTPAAANVLIGLLDHKDATFVKEALKGISIAKNPQAVAPVEKLLASPDAAIRFHAVRALIALNPPDLRARLEERAKTETDTDVKTELSAYLSSH